MAKKTKRYEEIFKQYIKYISTSVIEEYGGSYQTPQTMGETWREEVPYYQVVEEFILFKTNVFLKSLDNNNDRKNLNLMYDVCKNISQYLAPYLVKKSTDKISDEVLAKVSEQVFETIFLNSKYFASICKKHYKIDPTKKAHITCSYGAVALIRRQGLDR